MDRKRLTKMYLDFDKAQRKLTKTVSHQYQTIQAILWLMQDIEQSIKLAEYNLGEYKCQETGKWHKI